MQSEARRACFWRFFPALQAIDQWAEGWSCDDDVSNKVWLSWEGTGKLALEQGKTRRSSNNNANRNHWDLVMGFESVGCWQSQVARE